MTLKGGGEAAVTALEKGQSYNDGLVNHSSGMGMSWLVPGMGGGLVLPEWK